ncbi:Panacea domain-containing protein [Candidatus Poriferisocius sp.]|uniref:Panacea domain-containing protein n=1 Tax=Candidatus Poriferisocius sp. TaxID=3101276 RepID=UPI003B02EB57
MGFAYNANKFVEMVLHVADLLKEDRYGGATKLNKVLFFVEFEHLRRHHQVISGCEFQKLPHGPAPRQLKPVRDQLIESGEAKLVQEEFLDKTLDRLIPLRSANLALFSKDEMQTISEVVDSLKGITTAGVSELSHQEPGWQLAEEGETIPYSAAFFNCPQVRTPTTDRLLDSVAKRYGLVADK